MRIQVNYGGQFKFVVAIDIETYRKMKVVADMLDVKVEEFLQTLLTYHIRDYIRYID